MPAWFHSSIHTLSRISRQWLTFLGNTVAGIVAQILILLMTAVKPSWFQWSAWKNWKHASRKGLGRGLLAMIAVWGITFLICAFITLRQNHRDQEPSTETVRKNEVASHGPDVIAKQPRRSTRRFNRFHKRGESEMNNARAATARAHILFADILSYMSTVEMSRPMIVSSVSSPAIANKSLTASNQFEKDTLLDFLRRFSGRLYEAEQGFREQGIDTSRLESHLAQLINTQMIRLVAVDVNGMATELEHRNQQRPSPTKTGAGSQHDM